MLFPARMTGRGRARRELAVGWLFWGTGGHSSARFRLLCRPLGGVTGGFMRVSLPQAHPRAKGGGKMVRGPGQRDAVDDDLLPHCRPHADGGPHTSARRFLRARGNLSPPACGVLVWGGPGDSAGRGGGEEAPGSRLGTVGDDHRAPTASPRAPLASSGPGGHGHGCPSGAPGKGLSQKCLPSDIKKKEKKKKEDGRRAEPAQT